MTKKIDDVITDAMEISRKRGAALVAAGLNDLKEEYNKRLVKFVSGTMNQITELTAQRDRLDIAIKFQKDRLEAIHSGKFTVDARGNLTFTDGELNAGLLY